MQITFWGAAQQVTGSMHLLSTPQGTRILIDCGLDYQKRSEFDERNAKFPFQPEEIDILILTHAHIDHCGNIPNLIKQGFTGTIFCTQPTKELSTYLLSDSLKIQRKEYNEKLRKINRKGNKKKSGGQPIPQMLYSQKHIEDFEDMCSIVHFDKKYTINDEISFECKRAGHILGAISVAFHINYNGITKKIGFTGDLGNYGSKLVPDADPFSELDYLITESTYGGRLHSNFGNPNEDLLKHIVETCVNKNGKLIIPAFSVGRTQAILFTLHQLYLEGKLPNVKVFTDSPLAIKSTVVYDQNIEYLNEEASLFQRKHGSLFQFPNLYVIEDEKESEYLSVMAEPCIIVSAAGMVEGGRIQMHVRNNIRHAHNTILIAGFCAEGTLGHRLLQGQDFVEINNKKVPANAEVYKTDAFSAHPDQNGLIKYLQLSNNKNLKQVFLVHGDPPQQALLLDKLDFVNAVAPYRGEQFQLS